MNFYTEFFILNFYRLHPKDDGRLYFQFVCQFTHGGYPIQVTGGVPPSQVWTGGGVLYPADGGGVPHPTDRGYPLSRSGWGYPLRRWGVPYLAGGTHPWQGYPSSRGRGTPRQGYPPFPTRPAQRVLAMLHAVCLLRSRRRTFFFTEFLGRTLLKSGRHSTLAPWRQLYFCLVWSPVMSIL